MTQVRSSRSLNKLFYQLTFICLSLRVDHSPPSHLHLYFLLDLIPPSPPPRLSSSLPRILSRKQIQMARKVSKALWVLTVLWVITTKDCCISSVRRTTFTSFGFSQSPQSRTEPVCSCSLLTEYCSLYLLHDAREPYCPLYTRYCCDLELLSAVLPPSNVTYKGNKTPPATQARSSEALRALDSCGCTNYLLPCPVRFNENTGVSNGWFQCPYFYRYCCGVGVLSHVVLPYVANPEPEVTVSTQEQDKNEDSEAASWWGFSWLTG